MVTLVGFSFDLAQIYISSHWMTVLRNDNCFLFLPGYQDPTPLERKLQVRFPNKGVRVLARPPMPNAKPWNGAATFVAQTWHISLHVVHCMIVYVTSKARFFFFLCCRSRSSVLTMVSVNCIQLHVLWLHEVQIEIIVKGKSWIWQNIVQHVVEQACELWCCFKQASNYIFFNRFWLSKWQVI